MPTGVNYIRLETWKQKLPVRCGHYMDNFFNGCVEADPDTNFRHYVGDIDIYGATIKAYRDNRRKLIRAFYDITGTQEGSLG